MYQVWTKDEYEEKWALAECEEEAEVKEAIMVAVKAGQEVALTRPVGFSFNLVIREPKGKLKEAEEKLDEQLTDLKEKEVEIGTEESKPEKHKSTRG